MSMLSERLRKLASAAEVFATPRHQAAFVEAASPLNVLALLVELAQAESEREALIRSIDESNANAPTALKDALASLTQMSNDLARVTRERDAALASVDRKLSHDDDCALVQSPGAACDCADVGRRLRARLAALEADNMRMRETLEMFAGESCKASVRVSVAHVGIRDCGKCQWCKVRAVLTPPHGEGGA